MTATVTACWECDKPLAARVAKNGQVAKFCCGECRRAFGNRRAVRGAQVYDLVCAWRDPALRADGTSDALNLRSEICALELAWREEDEKAGRKVRYIPPLEALRNLREAGKLFAGEILAHAHQVGRK